MSHAAYALDALQIIPLNISNSGMAVVGLTLQGTSKADRAVDGFLLKPGPNALCLLGGCILGCRDGIEPCFVETRGCLAGLGKLHLGLVGGLGSSIWVRRLGANNTGKSETALHCLSLSKV